MSKFFGLDFGTTNSAIAVKEDGVGKVLEIDEAALDPRVVRTMLYFLRREMVIDPNINPVRLKLNYFKVGEVSYTGEQKFLIGQAAVETYLEQNKNRSEGVKRTFFTGRIIDTETLQEVKGGAGAVREYYEEIDYGTGRLIQALKTALKSQFYKGTTVFGKFYTLEELVQTFVGEVKRRAEEKLGETVDEVVVGRPVYFSDIPEKDRAAQDRLEKGLKFAGFKKITFEFEPVAAAKQFIKSQSWTLAGLEGVVFVFDFGGGTLDTAIVRGEKVLAADGVYIGGDLLNADILEAKLWKYFGAEEHWGDYRLPMPLYLYEALQSWFSIPNLNNPDTMQQLGRLKYKNTDPKKIDKLIYLIKANLGFDIYEAIEKAKKELSSGSEAVIKFSDGPINISEKITRTEFEEIIEPRVEEIKEVVLRTLKKAGVENSEVDVVVRTGGSSLIPIFEQMLAEIFGKQKLQQFETFTSIASGLALHH